MGRPKHKNPESCIKPIWIVIVTIVLFAFVITIDHLVLVNKFYSTIEKINQFETAQMKGEWKEMSRFIHKSVSEEEGVNFLKDVRID